MRTVRNGPESSGASLDRISFGAVPCRDGVRRRLRSVLLYLSRRVGAPRPKRRLFWKSNEKTTGSGKRHRAVSLRFCRCVFRWRLSCTLRRDGAWRAGSDSPPRRILSRSDSRTHSVFKTAFPSDGTRRLVCVCFDFRGHAVALFAPPKMFFGPFCDSFPSLLDSQTKK